MFLTSQEQFEIEDLCKKAISKWNINPQIAMLFEEMSELQLKILHFNRNRPEITLQNI